MGGSLRETPLRPQDSHDAEGEDGAQGDLGAFGHLQAPHEELREEPQGEVVRDGPDGVGDVRVLLALLVAVRAGDGLVPVCGKRVADGDGRHDDEDGPEDVDADCGPDCARYPFSHAFASEASGNSLVIRNHFCVKMRRKRAQMLKRTKSRSMAYGYWMMVSSYAMVSSCFGPS